MISRRRKLRFATDVAVLIALAILFFTRRDRGVPEMPRGFCAETDGTPALPDRVTIAAVFATIHGPEDVTGWSMTTLGRELEGRGFLRDGDRYVRADAVVEISGPIEDDADDVGVALERALAQHDIVYYNGHNFGGGLAIDTTLEGTLVASREPAKMPNTRTLATSPEPAKTPTFIASHEPTGAPGVDQPRRRMLILDTCYGAQLYSGLAEELVLIANTEKAITGSVFGFVDLLDGLLARDGRGWRTLLAPINAAARDRAALREDSEHPEAERYGLVGRCQGQAPADEP